MAIEAPPPTPAPPPPVFIKSISEAKAHFSSLLDNVGEGKQYVICKAGKPVAQLAPYVEQRKVRVPGLYKGKIWMAPDFDEWPEDIARALCIID